MSFDCLVKKVVGARSDRDYNSSEMYSCVTSRKVSARAVAAVSIFAAAFLIGLFAVAVANWPFFTMPPMVDRSTPQAQPCVEEDRISVFLPHPPQYESEGQLPYVQIVNNGMEPIYVFVDDEGWLVSSPLMVDEVSKHLRVSPVLVKPSESAWFKLWDAEPLSALDGRPLNVTFNYSKSDARHSHTVTIVFTDGRHSIPDRCYYK